MSRIEDHLMQTVRESIAQDRLPLPTLPEVALRIQRLARDEDVTAARLATEISRDPATAARLLKIANSASQRSRRGVDNLQMAIARIGMNLSCSIAIGLTVAQLFRARTPLIDQRLRATWTRSQEVAAMAQILAAHCTVLKPELAMLAGLVHEIGVLPVLRIADEQFPDVAQDTEALERVLAQLHPRTGALVLRMWNFPAEIADVPMQSADLLRRHDGPADYGDVISVARLQTHVGLDHPLAKVDRSTVPAFAKLDLSPEVDMLEAEGMQERYDDNYELLNVA